MASAVQTTLPLESNTAPTIIEQGKILDFIDGVTQRKDGPEEYVRQEIAKSLVREYGYAKIDIAVEFRLQIGSRKPRVDLAVFFEGIDHTQDQISIVIECKAEKVKVEDRKDGVEQLKSYLSVCPNAHYGMWTNGIERFCYRRIEKNGKVSIEEVPDLPNRGADPDEAERPTVEHLKPASSDSLLFTFKRCHNYIAGNQGLQKSEAFWELLKLIFCKIHDEKFSENLNFYATSAERNNLNGWTKVKKRLDQLFDEVKADFPAIFKSQDTFDLKPEVLAYLVSQMQMYSLLESDVDVKGRAYEEIVGSNLRGDRGEFFTPRNICQMAVAMLDPTEDDIILDPACGTGGFLITAMNYIARKIKNFEEQRGGTQKRIDKSIQSRFQKFVTKKIIGIDFNPSLVKATKMNMVMNNDGAGGLFQANSLENPVAKWNDALRARSIIGDVDLIFTNPPFGSKIPIDSPTILQQFDLAYQWKYDEATDKWLKSDKLQKSQPPEILFIERCVQFLKPGTGRMAIVLPDGILGSPGLGYVRQWILEHTRVLGSIDHHHDTFQPHVSVQTSLLVLEKKTDEEIRLEITAGKMNDYEVFMALANHIGHDKRGNATFVRDENGNEIVHERIKQVTEIVDGRPVITDQVVKEKVEDDNTQQIAQEFRKWLAQQDPN